MAKPVIKNVKDTKRAESELCIVAKSGTNLLDSTDVEKQITSGILSAIRDVVKAYRDATTHRPTSIFMSSTNHGLVMAALNDEMDEKHKVAVEAWEKDRDTQPGKVPKSPTHFRSWGEPVVLPTIDGVIVRSHCGVNRMEVVLRRMDGDEPTKKASDD